MNIPTEKEIFSLALKGTTWDFGYLNREDKQQILSVLKQLGFLRQSGTEWVAEYGFRFRMLAPPSPSISRKHESVIMGMKQGDTVTISSWSPRLPWTNEYIIKD